MNRLLEAKPLVFVVDKVTARMHRLDALRFVNYIRYEFGMKPLRDLQRGDPSEAECCPIARSIQMPGLIVSVEQDHVLIQIPHAPDPGIEIRRYETPPEVADFIERFDAGRYPDLIAAT